MLFSQPKYGVKSETGFGPSTGRAGTDEDHMNREYAIEILEKVESGTLESACALAREAYRYLKRLKSTDQILLDRIYNAQYKKQW